MSDSILVSINDYPFLIDKDVEDIRKILEIGNFVYELALKQKTELSIQDPNLNYGVENQIKLMSEHFTELRHELNDTKKEIVNTNALMNKTMNNSCRKGEFSENYVFSLLKENFPDDVFELKTQTSHGGDIHMLPVKSNDNILIEVKAYKATVPTCEISKFHGDLDRVGFPLGLFVSLTSSITRKHRLEVSRHAGKLCVFIPNALNSPYSIIYGIIVLQQMNEFEKQANRKLVNLASMTSNIEIALLGFDEHLHRVSMNYHDMKKKLDAIDVLTMEVRRILMESKDDARHVLSNVKKAIRNEITCFQNSSVIEKEDIEKNGEFLQALVQEQKSNRSKLYPIFSTLVDFVIDNEAFLIKGTGKNTFTLYNSSHRSIALLTIRKTNLVIQQICEKTSGMKITMTDTQEMNSVLVLLRVWMSN